MEQSAWQKRRNGQSTSVASSEPVSAGLEKKSKSLKEARDNRRLEEKNSRYHAPSHVTNQPAADLNPFSVSEDSNDDGEHDKHSSEEGVSADGNNSDERSVASNNSRSNLITAEKQKISASSQLVLALLKSQESIANAAASGPSSYGVGDSMNPKLPKPNRYNQSQGTAGQSPSTSKIGRGNSNRDEEFAMTSVYPVSSSSGAADSESWSGPEKSEGMREYTNVELALPNEPETNVYDTPGRVPYRNNSENINLIYHKNRMSEPWLYTALVIHVVQFGMLLVLGRRALPSAALIVLVLLILSVIFLLLYSRRLVRKNRRREGSTLFRKKLEGGNHRTPDEEMDHIPENAIYCLAVAAILEGCLFALYTVIMAGNDSSVDSGTGIASNPHSSQIILETLRFASITLLAFHRILRPANRVDPMRTMLEVKNVLEMYRFRNCRIKLFFFLSQFF